MTAHAVRARYTASVARHTKPGPVTLADHYASFKAHGGHAHPRQSVTAKRLGVSVRTIQRWQAQLREAGLLVITTYKPQQHHITGRWRRRPNGYRCTFQNSRPPREPVKPQVKPRRQECHLIALYEEPIDGSAPESAVSPPDLAADLAATWAFFQIEPAQ